MKTFKPGQKLQGRSICDYNCIFSGMVLSRTDKNVLIKNPHGKEKRCKVFMDQDGEYIYPVGRYSMAPIFRA